MLTVPLTQLAALFILVYFASYPLLMWMGGDGIRGAKNIDILAIVITEMGGRLVYAFVAVVVFGLWNL